MSSVPASTRFDLLARTPLLSANYHDIPPDARPFVIRRLRRLADVDGGRSAAELSSLGSRAIVCFYDGFRDAALFGADLCHSLGLKAIFFPIFRASEPRAATLTEADLADLAKAHEIGFHTFSHVRADDIGPSDVLREIDEPLRKLARLTGRPVRVGAWRGGARLDVRQLGNQRLLDWGLTHLMSNWSLETISDIPGGRQAIGDQPAS